jgi:periplasmic divalent cation tolerance protein
MTNATDAIVVFITAPTAEEASQLANVLVEDQLAACVQILPEMESVYRWQGKIERQKEILIIVKTVASKFKSLETTVRGVHSYETPEIVAFPVTAGSSPYLQWLVDSVGADSGSG